MSTGDASPNDGDCQWLDELPYLGPVTLNAFDRQLWESLLDCNGNNNSQRGQLQSPAEEGVELLDQDIVDESRSFSQPGWERPSNRIESLPPLPQAPPPPRLSSAYHRRQASALRRATRAYRRLQAVVNRFRRSVERREAASQSQRLSPEEEPDSSALSQDIDRLSCCRNRHPPPPPQSRKNVARQPATQFELSSSSSLRSDFSARIFAPPSVTSNTRWQPQQLTMESRCRTSLSHIGATHSLSQHFQQKQQRETQSTTTQVPLERLSFDSPLTSQNSQVAMEFSADDSTFSYTDSPGESLASPQVGEPTNANQPGAPVEQLKRPLRLVPPAPLQTTPALTADTVRALPSQRPRRQQQIVQQQQQQQQTQQNKRHRNLRSGCIAVASQRLCTSNDGRFAWAAKSWHGCGASGCSRACSQCLCDGNDNKHPLERILSPLHCSPILELVNQKASLGQAGSAEAVSSVASWTLQLNSPVTETALRFVAAADAKSEPETQRAASPAVPFFWPHQAPAAVFSWQPQQQQQQQQPLYRWPPPPAGSLIGLPSNAAASPGCQTAVSASSSSGGGRSSSGATAVGREKLQQQRQLRRTVQVMQMRRKPSSTDYVGVPSGGDSCLSGLCRRRCDLLEDLLKRRNEIDELLTVLQPGSACQSPTSSRFYSFGGSTGGVEGRISSSATKSQSDASCSREDANSINSVCSSSSSNSSRSTRSSGSSELFFATPSSALCRTVNNNADTGPADSQRRRRTYYARRCIVRLEESAALLIQEPVCRASSVVAACSVQQDSIDSDSGLLSCSSAVQPAVQAMRLTQRLQALERRTLRRAWDRPPLSASSLAALDPTVASFIWWSLIPLHRRLKPLPSPPPRCRLPYKTELEMWAADSSKSVASSETEDDVTSAVIGQQLIVDVPVSS